MNRFVAGLAGLYLILSASSVWALGAGASLTNISGSVLVDGVAYTGEPLKVGSVITVAGNGAATLIYSDGCGVSISVSASAVVSAGSPCALGANGITGTNAFVAGGVVSATSVIVGIAQSKPASP